MKHVVVEGGRHRFQYTYKWFIRGDIVGLMKIKECDDQVKTNPVSVLDKKIDKMRVGLKREIKEVD
ncbi:unnamed protein product [Prunus armeniaca]|uniref:Uncharacterized protein n=1 Tax=Prunus armeniaca TaxID=36596 RepID=A0A6J5X516_PRUAR|nr:unnamed protein product [Prunus armeniaca]CAB4308870.1 unnamed protein product [Prunus armeniaca]